MKVIKSFVLDTKDIGSGGEDRALVINADKGALFSMEIMNEDNKYYNFQTNSFQTTKTRLSDISIQNTWRRSISFPPVTDADKYDIYVFAGKDTKHVERKEVRFADGRLDINSSTGSNSILLQKIIYQTLDTTITISGYSPNNTVTLASFTTDSITASNGKSVAKIPFSITTTVTSTRTLSINRQPVTSDIMAFVTATVVATPVDIPGEDIYPAVTGTDTVNGTVSSTDVIMDTAVASTMKVGDRVTGNTALSAATVTVVSLDSTYGFTLSETIAIADGITLSFSNQRNYRWALDNIYGLTPGMRQLKGTLFAAQPTIKEYLTQITIFENEIGEYKVDDVRIPALDTLGAKPSMIRNATTFVETITQTGNIVFSEQALLALGGGANAKIFSYGAVEINRLTDYDVEFSDLAVVLTEVSTTTTAAVSASTSVPITQRAGIMDGISTVSGIGIDSSVANPTVSSGAGSVIGGGTLVLSAAQTLEDGITLTFPGAGTIATVTGYIKVNRAGSKDVTLRFDLEKFLTMH